MSIQAASSTAINWHLLDDQPPEYTAEPSAGEEAVASPSHLSRPINMDLASLAIGAARSDITKQRRSSHCDPLDEQPQTSNVQPDFHADDYVVDDDHIPSILLTHDNWLPDPPSEPPKPRPADFRALHPYGSAVLTFEDNDGLLGKIENLDVNIIAIKSPLIAAAFEHSDHGQQCLHLDALTSLSAQPFARYLYLGSYAEVDDEFEQVPSSLLLHVQLHYLAALFDITELQSQALVNVIRQCEFGCFSHEQPIDLCAALRFCYDHHAYCLKPIDNIIAYCITRFVAHKLGEDTAFRLLAYEHQQFRGDLARILVERNFADEAAIDLIRLPYYLADETSQPSIDALLNPRNKLAVGRSQIRKDTQVIVTPDEKMTSLPLLAGPASSLAPPSSQQSLLTLALRSKHRATDDLEPDTETMSEQNPHKRRKSEDDGFVLVSPLVTPVIDLPIRTVDELSNVTEDFELLSGPASPITQEDEELRHKVNSSSNLVSLSPVDEPVLVEGNELQASSPRSESSWVLT